jgi:hypothetical protein
MQPRLNVDQGPRRLCPTVFLQNRKWESYFFVRGLRQNSWIVENQQAKVICRDGRTVAVKYVEGEEVRICGAKHYKKKRSNLEGTRIDWLYPESKKVFMRGL